MRDSGEVTGVAGMQCLPDIRRIMCDVLRVTPDDIEPATVPNDVPEWDSLSHITLVVALEQELGIRLGVADVERMTSVAAICDLVAGKLARG